MGHQPRPPLSFALLSTRLRHLLRLCYPSFIARRAVYRPLSLISIIFVLSLILTGVYLVIPLTLLPQLPAHPVQTTLLLLVFVWSVSCTLLSYLLTAFHHPGRVPESWRPNHWQYEALDVPSIPLCESTSDSVVASDHPPVQRIKYPIVPPPVIAAGTAMLRRDGRHRFCVHCNAFKPDRTHHCSTCNQCVLLMDHHCPFTGNSCIGFYNRKFFLLFLYYATFSCVQVAVLTPPSILNRLFHIEQHPSTFSLISLVLIMMGYIFCALHAIALFPFSAFHTYLVLKNRTTIENQEPSTALHGDVLRRMDRESWHNWTATFGTIPSLWFIPVSYGRVGDGVTWSQPHHIV